MKRILVATVVAVGTLAVLATPAGAHEPVAEGGTAGVDDPIVSDAAVVDASDGIIVESGPIPVDGEESISIISVGQPQIPSTRLDPDVRPFCLLPGSVCTFSDGDAWHVFYRQQVRYAVDGSSMRHDFAQTERDVGSGKWHTKTHAALIKGHSYSGTQVFSAYTHACADQSVTKTTNGKVSTCSSPYQGTSRGAKWLLVSGHTFDQSANGTTDGACHGCIDWKWSVP